MKVQGRCSSGAGQKLGGCSEEWMLHAVRPRQKGSPSVPRTAPDESLDVNENSSQIHEEAREREESLARLDVHLRVRAEDRAQRRQILLEEGVDAREVL